MYLYRIAVIAAATILATPALACKCFTNGHQDNGKTQSCCNQRHGVFRYGNDCEASSISQHLSNFLNCCGVLSDCDYPRKAGEEAVNAEDESKLPPGAVQTIVVV